MLSDYYKKVADEYGIEVADVMKLIANGVLPYRNLHLYLCYEWNGLKFNECWNLNNLTGWKNTSTLTLKKEQMLLIVFKEIFLNWWFIVSMAKQWKIYKKESMSG